MPSWWYMRPKKKKFRHLGTALILNVFLEIYQLSINRDLYVQQTYICMNTLYYRGYICLLWVLVRELFVSSSSNSDLCLWFADSGQQYG